MYFTKIYVRYQHSSPDIHPIRLAEKLRLPMFKNRVPICLLARCMGWSVWP